MKTIVCAVDGSPGGLEALRVAALLSDALGLRLVLTHVAPGRRAIDGRIEGGGQGRHQAEELLERTAQDAGLDGDADRRAETGDRAAMIARVAAEEAAAVLVVGSRSQGRSRRRLLSGLAAELNTTAPCPVLVVPPPARR
jgi:nucleotide-binding universal stress UspA family protein